MSYEDKDKLKAELFKILYDKGAVLVGAADMSGFTDTGLNTGVSAAVAVPAEIVKDLQTAPTEEYMEMYKELNNRLDKIVTAGAEFLISRGYRAYANTTDVIKKDENWCTPIPHKTFATRAGIGWIGKSCLLVTKKYGSSIRLSSLLTDAPLPTDEPIVESKCGNCRICVENCPGKALKGTLWTAGMKREEILYKERCKKTQIERMKAATGISTDLCGKCFAVCPYTIGRLNRENINGG